MDDRRPITLAGSESGLPTVGLAREESARRRDHEADERDALATGRDLQADLDDQAAVEFDGVDGHEPASLARERGKRDRGFARADRELGERDRRESRRDREYAGTDELTGTRRRGVGLEDVQREIDRARRTGEPLAVAYVDVNGLKKVNDYHGHHAGDKLLQGVVESLRRDMRSYDLLVRVGGDEFVCIMPGITADQARRRFDHLDSIARASVRSRSVSIGVSELRNGEGPAELIDRADQDLLAHRSTIGTADG